MADDKDKPKQDNGTIEGKGFVFKDKRRFKDEEEHEQETEKPQAEPEGKQAAPEEETPGVEDQGQALPEINFINFILSMSTSAMVHLGDVPDPFTKEINTNLPAAKQTIDILGMLEEKTRGNLDKDEEQLMTNALYQLRMRYVDLMKGRGPQGS